MAKVFLCLSSISVIGAESTLTMIMVMEVTTENGDFTLPYLFHCREGDVQVAHSRLWEAFCGLTLFKERKTTAGLLAGISHLERQHCFFMYLVPLEGGSE